jgi:predicted RNA binding protein YcfA (HicA-like mRNA interferase family)
MPFLHVGARYYDPATGRFLQRDPIGVDGALNFYEYADSSPIFSIDPLGLSTSISNCLRDPGMLALCLDNGWANYGALGKRYVGKGQELVKLLTKKKWGGQVIKGGKGSHCKIRMPNGKTITVPHKPGNGTVEQIFKDVLKGA